MNLLSRNNNQTISVGEYHTVAVKNDGTVTAIGDNRYGQCNVSGWKDIVSVAAGQDYTIGLKSNGTVEFAGDSKLAEEFNELKWNDIVAISASFHIVALKNDGTVLTFRGIDEGECDVSEWKDIVAISAGFGYTVGIKSDGTVLATGINKFDQCNVSLWTNIMSVATSYDCTAGLRSDGTIMIANSFHTHQDIILYENIICVSIGINQIFALQANGRVISSTPNNDISKEISNWTDIVSIAASQYHIIGLKSDGTLLAAGKNKFGQCNVSQVTDVRINKQDYILSEKTTSNEDTPKVILNKNIERIFQSRNKTISAGGDHTLAVLYDGRVIATGNKSDGQCDVSGWRDIISVSAGTMHSVGLKSNGTVVATGDESYGFIRDHRCDVYNWKNIISISAGSYHTVGLLKNGTVVALGDNSDGQCNVSDWTNIVAISAGEDHTLGLKSDGTVVAVGSNKKSQCNVENWVDIIEIAAGSFCSVGLKSDGTVVITDAENQIVPTWKNIVDISASLHILGLQSNGKVLAAGNNLHNQCNVANWSNIVAVSAGSHYSVGIKADGTAIATGYDGEYQCAVDGFKWHNIKIYLNENIDENIRKIVIEAQEKAILSDKLYNLQEYANKGENIIHYFTDTSRNLKQKIYQAYETIQRIDQFAQNTGLNKEQYVDSLTLKIKKDDSNKENYKGNTISLKDLCSKCFLVDGKKYDTIENAYAAAENFDTLSSVFYSVNKDNVTSVLNTIEKVKNMQYEGASQKAYIAKLNEYEKALRTVNGVVLNTYEEAEKARGKVNDCKKYVAEKYGNLDLYRFTNTGLNNVKNALEDINNVFGKFADLKFVDECKKYVEECQRINNVDLKKTCITSGILAVGSIILSCIAQSSNIGFFSIAALIILIILYTKVRDIIKKCAFTKEIKALNKVRNNKIVPLKRYYIQVVSLALIVVLKVLTSVLKSFL